MPEPKSPFPRDRDSEEDSDGEDDPQLDADDDDEEQAYYQQQIKEQVNPNNRALLDFVDTVPTGKLDWSKADEIFAQYPALSKTSELTGKTVLHMLIDSWTKYIEVNLKVVPLIRKAFVAIVTKYPELVQVRDTLDLNSRRISGQTVLYSAIASGQPRIIDTIVKNTKPTDTASSSGKKSKKANDPLSQAISVRCSVDGREENSLHFALRSSTSVISPETLKKIVRKATETAVAAMDSYGFTPLHYAVDYARCSKEQYSIVKSLLKTGETRSLIKSGKAVLDFVTVNDELSVYRYHIKTREQFREKAPPTKSNQSKSAKTEEDLRNLRKQEEEKREKEIERQRKQQQDQQRERARGRADGDSDSEGEAGKGARPPRNAQPERTGQTLGKGAPKGSDSRGPGFKGLPNGPSKEGPRDKELAEVRGRDARIDPRGPGGARDESQRPKGDNRPRDPPGQDPKTPLKRTATVTFEEPEPEETPEDRKRKRDEWSDKMKMDIKVQYLRTRSHHRAVKFLYGKNPNDIQISFEYEGLAIEADADTFKDSFRDMTFDNVLKYVAFPAVFVRNWRKNPLRVAPGEEATRGRSDMLYFFKWLREDKGVDRILKVIVDDSKKPPHSDEAIELSLKPFGVEVLDWSKPDLDPETICSASNDLTELVLHWSGNNAVLRAWSEPEGLRKLPDLSLINLVVDSTLEGTERTKRYILDFEKRLQIPYAPFVPPTQPTEPLVAATSAAAAADRAAMPPPPAPNSGVRRTTTGVVVNVDKTDESLAPPRAPASPDPSMVKPLRPIAVKGGLEGLSLRPRNIGASGSGNGDAANLSTPPHRWLDSTDAFAQRIDNVWRKIVAERNKDVANALAERAARGTVTPTERAEIMKERGPPPDIIVAVIDDGVDTTVEELIGRVLTGRTFDYEEDGDRVRPWYVSENSHGTIMASMVVRVCRMAKIYPIRLRTVGGAIDPMSAAQAIEAAIDRGAHIISMSWTVGVPPAKSELKTAFDKALARAIDNNILMFCSSKDSGHVGDTYYPAGYRPGSVIRIGAANPTGLPYEWAGSLEDLDFIFPGVEVVQQHDNKPSGIAKLKAKTGSSVATALGAGLAALIMYCARIAHLYGHVGLTEADVDRLRRRNVMVEAIVRFGPSTSEKTEGKFIEVWKRLDGRTRDLQRAMGDNRTSRELIASLARDLINTSS